MSEQIVFEEENGKALLNVFFTLRTSKTPALSRSLKVFEVGLRDPRPVALPQGVRGRLRAVLSTADNHDNCALFERNLKLLP